MSYYEIGCRAYDETLANHHNWLLRMTVKGVLLAINNLEGFSKYYTSE